MISLFLNIKDLIWKNKGFILAICLALLLLIPSAWGIKNSQDSTVLAATTQASPTLSPTTAPTLTPSPTKAATKFVTLTPTPSTTPASTSTANTGSPSTPTVTQTPTPTITPTPTPATITVKIGIDYTGAKSNDDYTVLIQPGQTAWDAVVQAIGLSNIQYDQYSFGIFITGLNGVAADPNSQYYEFRVNGASSSVGVSDYNLNDNDQLNFVLTSF